MKRYSSLAGSRLWWWPPAAGGVATSAAIAAIALVAIPSNATTVQPSGDQGSSVAAPAGGKPLDRPCFLVRPSWNDAVNGPQPRCHVRGHDADSAQRYGTADFVRGLRRPGVGD